MKIEINRMILNVLFVCKIFKKKNKYIYQSAAKKYIIGNV
jgi:hypothetical protein